MAKKLRICETEMCIRDRDKQEVQDTIDILKEAIAKNKPLEQVPEDMWKLIEF